MSLKKYSGDALALLLLLAAVILFFWPVINGYAWLPKGGGDSVSFIFPMYRFAAQSLWSGTIPLWNPYQYAGTPFISDNQTGIFYPINLLLFLLNRDFSYRAIEGLVIWHVFFAGAGMYVCLRLLSKAQPLWRPAAVTGALAFMFSGIFVSHVGNLNLIAVASWLPAVFIALHRGLMAASLRASLPWVLGGGLALGISTLAGHGQMTFMLAAYLAAYAIFSSLVTRQLRPLLLLLILGLTAMGVAAVNLLPSLEALPLTVRQAFGSEQASNYSLPLRSFLGLLAPEFFGRNEVNFWGGWPRAANGYVGVLTLFLAAYAFATQRTKLLLFFALSALFCLLLSLGDNFPLYPLLLRILPVFPFQVPARFVLLLDFSLAAAAAIGLDQLRRRERGLKTFLVRSAAATIALGILFVWQYTKSIKLVPHHQAQMIQAASVFALFALGSWLIFFSRRRQWLDDRLLAVTAVALLGVDLITLGRYVEIEWNDPMPGFAAESAALEFIKSDLGINRIDIATGAWQPNLPQMEGLYSIRGVYNPLELANYSVYIGSVGFRGSPLYNLLGTKYVIGGKKSPPADTNIIVPVFDDDPDVTIFLNTLSLPRASVVYSSSVVAGGDEAFAAIHAEQFDPRREVILEEGVAANQGPGEFSIGILQYDPNFASFEVETDRPGYFVLSDIYHPHWQATVDGVAAPILVADYALRAIKLEPGIHTVEMRFVPPGWIWGRRISLTSGLILLALIMFWIWHYFKQRRNY